MNLYFICFNIQSSDKFGSQNRSTQLTDISSYPWFSSSKWQNAFKPDYEEISKFKNISGCEWVLRLNISLKMELTAPRMTWWASSLVWSSQTKVTSVSTVSWNKFLIFSSKSVEWSSRDVERRRLLIWPLAKTSILMADPGLISSLRSGPNWNVWLN